MKRHRWLGMGALMIVALLSACGFLPNRSPTSTPTPTSTVTVIPTDAVAPTDTVAPTPTSTASATLTPSPATTSTETPTITPSPCVISAQEPITVYQRPDVTADVFGTMDTNISVIAEARTADGWLGFDPAVAQAANVGVFRLRWVQESDPLILEGACDTLPEVVGPPAGVCFTMPMMTTPIYAEADTTAEVVVTLEPGDYAAVIARDDDWAQVDLAPGNTGLEDVGWVDAATLNLNGPCDALPTPTP